MTKQIGAGTPSLRVVTEFLKPRSLLTIVLVLISALSIASAAIEQRKFDDPVLSERYANLIAELRCLVCQNQNLADSDAAWDRKV